MSDEYGKFKEMKKGTNIAGYLVSCPRIPDGRFFKDKKTAKKEMDRQMRAGASQSGLSEIHKADAHMFKEYIPKKGGYL